MVEISSKIKQASSFKMPTIEQLKTFYIMVYWNTKMYVPINLARIDERTNNLIILAGEESEITIYPNGKWRYS
jgi:hypothetical protein